MRIMHGNGSAAGDTFDLAFANITSLQNKYAHVADIAGQGILAMCETNQTAGLRKQIDAEMQARRGHNSEIGAYFHYGQDRGGPRSSGVAIAVSPTFRRRVERLRPPSEAAARLEAEGRLSAFAISCAVPKRTFTDRGEVIIYIFVVYGDAPSRARAEQLLRTTESWVMQLGQAPIFVTGDFNLQVPGEVVGDGRNSSALLDRWHLSGFLYDLGRLLCKGQPEATCLSTRRIDYIFGSLEALRVIDVSHGLTVLDGGFKTHSMLQITIKASAFSIPGWVRQVPASLVGGDSQVADPDPARLADIISFKQNEWNDACNALMQARLDTEDKRDALNTLLAIWSERAERLLCHKIDKPWHPRLRQRGRTGRIKQSYAAPRHTRAAASAGAGTVHDALVRRLMHLQRRLQAVAKMRHVGPQRLRTWHLLRCALIQCAIEHRLWLPFWPPEGLPSAEECRALESVLTAGIAKAQSNLSRDRIQVWKTRMKGNGRFKWIRSCAATTCDLVEVPDSQGYMQLTADWQLIDDHLAEAWSQVWEPVPCELPEAVATIMNLLPHVEQRPLSPLTGDAVTEAVRGSKGVPGADGWHAEELRKVPELHDQLACIFECMEHAGVAPSAHLEGDVSMVPKAGGGFRPICILATLHRAWARARCNEDLFGWQEQWAHDLPMFGCRRKKSPRDAVVPLMLLAEQAQHENRTLHVITYDLTKAFDSLPLEPNGVMWNLMDQLGFPTQIATLLKDMRTHFTRRFKVNGHLGMPRRQPACRGALQGCAFSMFLMNVATVPWFCMCRQGLPLADATRIVQALREREGWDDEAAQRACHLLSRPAAGDLVLHRAGYADDLHAASMLDEEVERVHVITIVWAAVLSVDVNTLKSRVSSDTLRLAIRGRPLPAEALQKILGDFFAATVQDEPVAAWLPDDRITECLRRVQRCAHLPGSQRERLATMAVSALPVLYGMEFSHVSELRLRTLRRSIWSAGRDNSVPPNTAMAEVYFTVIQPGHRLDPYQCLAYGLLRFFLVNECLHVSHADRVDLLRLAAADPEPTLRPSGGLLVRGVTRCLRAIQWQWEETGLVVDHIGIAWRLPLSDEDKAQALHALRDGIRLATIRDVTSASRRDGLPARPDMEGSDGGLDWAGSRKALSVLDPWRGGLLTQTLTGAALTRERLHRHGRLPPGVDATCPHCDLDEPETREHRLWWCPAWEHLRSDSMRRIRASLHLVPMCLRICGLLPHGFMLPGAEEFPIVDLHTCYANIEDVARAVGIDFGPADEDEEHLDDHDDGDDGDDGDGPPNDGELQPAGPADPGGHATPPDPAEAPAPPEPPADGGHPPPPPPAPGEGCGRSIRERRQGRTHSAEDIVFTETRVSCTRCHCSSTRSSTTGMQRFWSSPCLPVEGAGRRRAGHAVQRQSQEAKLEAQLVELSCQHGNQLLWSGWRHGPARCKHCAGGFDWHTIRWKQNRGSPPVPLCMPEPITLAERAAALADWVDAYRAKRLEHSPLKRRLRRKSRVDQTAHAWQPAAGGIVCTRCGGFLFEAPQQRHSRWDGDCPAPLGVDDRTRQRCSDITTLELSSSDLKHMMFGACLSSPVDAAAAAWNTDGVFHSRRRQAKRRLDAPSQAAKRQC